jgi:elongation factor G
VARLLDQHHRHPGHVDFTVEVERSLRVLDGAVAVFDAVAGRRAPDRDGVASGQQVRRSRMCFVNKMDRVGADFYRCLDMIKDRLDAEAAVVQLPIGAESEFRGVIDLLEMKALVWDDGMGEQVRGRRHPGRHGRRRRDLAARARRRRLPARREHPREVRRRGGDHRRRPRKGLRHATISAGTVPILCGTAFKNKGVQPLLDAVVDYLPSPLDVTAIVGPTSRARPRWSGTPTTPSRSRPWRSRS